MKYGYMFVVIGLLCFILPLGVEAKSPPQVFYGEQEIVFDVKPEIVKGTTMVQFRPIFEALGLEVKWEPERKIVRGKNASIDIELTLDQTRAYVNGRRFDLEVAPYSVNGSTLVPLRFIGEATGKEVLWDQYARRIDIGKGYDRVETANPYGQDSFLALTQVQEHHGINPNIYESEEHLYVTWYNEERVNEHTYLHFYVSVAKDNKWIHQAKKMHTVWVVGDQGYTVLFVDGSYYLKMGSHVTQISPLSSGGVATKTIISNLPSQDIRDELFLPVLVEGKVGFLYHGEYRHEKIATTYSRIYYESGSSYNNFHNIKDIYGVVKDLRKVQENHLSFNPKTKILYLLEPQGYRQLNTVTGDLVYGFDGKDLVESYVKGKDIRSSRLVLYNGQYHIFYEDREKSSWLYGVLDNKFQSRGLTKVEIDRDTFQRGAYLSFKRDQIRSWRVYEYNRKPSIELTRFVK